MFRGKSLEEKKRILDADVWAQDRMRKFVGPGLVVGLRAMPGHMDRRDGGNDRAKA